MTTIMLTPAQPAMGAGYSVMIAPTPPVFQQINMPDDCNAKQYVPRVALSAADNATFAIDPAASSFPLDGTLDVNIRLTTTGPTDSAGFQLTWLSSDNSTHLTCVSIDKGSFFSNGTIVGNGGDLSGSGMTQQYAVGLFGSQQPTATGVLATLHFRASQMGTYILHLYECQPSLGGELLQVFTADGQVTVTEPVGPTAPTAPSNLKATSISYNQVGLAWTNTWYDVDRFKIERNDGKGFKTISEADNTTSYLDSQLSENNTYSYRVSAHNAQGYSGYSNILQVSTYMFLPQAPTNFRVTSKGTGEVDLAWDDNANNETGYRLERLKELKITGWQTNPATWQPVYLAADTTTYADTGVQSDNKYYYRIYAYNKNGDSTPSATLIVSTQKTVPVAPTNLKVRSAAAKKVELYWQNNADNQKGFIVERGDPTHGFDVPAKYTINNADATSYTDISARDGITYRYRVSAYNEYGPSLPASYVDVDIPAVPTLLKAEVTDFTQVNLTWKDNAKNEKAYRIERALNAAFSQELTRFYTTPNAVKYSDTSAKPGTTYFYRVVAQNRDSDFYYTDSSPSLAASVSTGTPPKPEDVKTTSISISKFVDENGISKKNIVITSLEGIKSLEIGAKNQLLTYDDKALESIEVSQVKSDTLRLLKSRVIALPNMVFKPANNSPLPPVSITEEYSAQIVGPVVDFQPSGAHFFKPVTLTLHYDQAGYPIDRAQKDLVLAYYDAYADKWVELTSRVNPVGRTVSADISHFSTIGIVRKAERVVDYWRMIAIIACEMVVAMLLFMSLLLRRRPARG